MTIDSSDDGVDKESTDDTVDSSEDDGSSKVDCDLDLGLPDGKVLDSKE